MRNQGVPQHDFFIYVPSLQDEKLQPHIAAATPALPAQGEDWIKIALADALIVYARICDEQERLMCAS